MIKIKNFIIFNSNLTSICYQNKKNAIYIYNYAENILKIKRNKNKNILKLKKLHYRKIFKNKDCFCFNKCMHLLIYKERKINFKNF